MLQKLLSNLLKDKTIVIYGAGRAGQLIAQKMKLHRHEQLIFVDSIKEGLKIQGREVKPVSFLETGNKEGQIILTGGVYYLEISELLTQKGFVENRDFFDCSALLNPNEAWLEEVSDLEGWNRPKTSSLPKIEGMENTLYKGRNIYEGYQRNLCLDSLRHIYLDDPLFMEAISKVKNRTILSFDKMINIYLLMKYFLKNIPGGNIIEFGSYRCGCAIFMAYVAQRILPGIQVHALDTFEGMPETDKTKDAHSEKDFNIVDLGEIRSYIASLGLKNLFLHQGLFKDIAFQVLNESGPIALAHIDCDIYQSVAYSYDIVKPHMVDGGYVLFDDANAPFCLGATEAVEDLVISRDGLKSEQITPHYAFRLFKKRDRLESI